MNKKGLYFATLTIVILIIFVVSYNTYLIAKENDVALGKIGEVASSSIEIFYEAERVKYYINEAAKYSALKAIFLTGENGGIYDSKDCGSIDADKIKYIIWKDNCLPNKDDDFKSYFNGIFKEYLNNINYNLENFDINIENNNIKGIASKRLELNIGSVSNVDVKYKIKESDDEKVESGRIQPYILGIIKKYSTQYDVPEDLVIAVIIQESNGNRYAVSEVGAAGLMQLMPETAESLGLKNTIYHCDKKGDYSSCDCIASKKDSCDYKNDERFNAEKNLDAGINYLGNLLNRYGDINLALAAYNWGPDRVNRNCDLEEGFSSCKNVPAETKNYIEKILNWMGLSGGEIIQELGIKKYGSYSFYPNFLIDLNYDLNEYNKIKAIAENCLDKECVSMDYIIKKNKLENLIVFEFESREKLKDIEPVVIRFALPVET